MAKSYHSTALPITAPVTARRTDVGSASWVGTAAEVSASGMVTPSEDHAVKFPLRAVLNPILDVFGRRCRSGGSTLKTVDTHGLPRVRVAGFGKPIQRVLTHRLGEAVPGTATTGFGG